MGDLYMINFNQYVNEHLLRQITIGKSGALVYELDNSRIAKCIRLSELASDALRNSYEREYLFYTHFSSSAYPFLPKIYHCCQSDDEIQIIMEKYLPLDRSRLDTALLEKIMSILAQIHSLPIPDFLPNVDTKPVVLDPSDITQYLLGWKEVINEHGDAFSEHDLYRIAENINTINQKVHSTRKSVCHGDFHFENLLADAHDNIIVCDWQNINLGHVSGDISFLLSRLSADGCDIKKETAIQIYCNLPNTDITPNEIATQMSLANLNTSFMFWHNYLHGAPEDRVHDILGKMIEDLDCLLI